MLKTDQNSKLPSTLMKAQGTVLCAMSPWQNN